MIPFLKEKVLMHGGSRDIRFTASLARAAKFRLLPSATPVPPLSSNVTS